MVALNRVGHMPAPWAGAKSAVQVFYVAATRDAQ